MNDITSILIHCIIIDILLEGRERKFSLIYEEIARTQFFHFHWVPSFETKNNLWREKAMKEK